MSPALCCRHLAARCLLPHLRPRPITVRAARLKRECQSLDGPNSVLLSRSDKAELRAGERTQESARSPALNQATSRIARLTRAGDWAAALEVYRAVDEPDGTLFSAALNACCKELRHDEAWALWNSAPPEMKSVISYSTMIQFCGRLRRADDASRLFSEMRDAGVQPNVITYTSLIHAKGMAGCTEEALTVFEELRTQLLPSCSEVSRQMAFMSVLTAVARVGDYAKAREFFSMMVESSIPPTQMHFNALITACARDADAETAKGVFDTMLAWKLQPRVDDFTILISCSRNDLQRCLDIWADMDRAGKQPTRVTYQEMLQAHVLARDGAGARELLKRADSAGARLEGRKMQRLLDDVAALP